MRKERTETDFLFGVERVQNNMSCNLRALGFVQDAMERGERSIGEYADAVYGLWQTLTECGNVLEELVELELHRKKGE